MTADYWDRMPSNNSDGTPLYTNDYDLKSEDAIKNAVEQAWNCTLHHFGRLCPLDFYAVRDGRMVGIIEAKSRSHNASAFPTVFLNVRKWLALTMASVGLGVPALYVVRFLDGIRYISVHDIDAAEMRIGGTQKKAIQGHRDIEPVIEVPVASMRLLVIPLPSAAG